MKTEGKTLVFDSDEEFDKWFKKLTDEEQECFIPFGLWLDKIDGIWYEAVVESSE